jgi:hypothetical protein
MLPMPWLDPLTARRGGQIEVNGCPSFERIGRGARSRIRRSAAG